MLPFIVDFVFANGVTAVEPDLFYIDVSKLLFGVINFELDKVKSQWKKCKIVIKKRNLFFGEIDKA